MSNGRLGPRSPNFPGITLREALIRAQQLFVRAERNPTSRPQIAETWGYSSRSSDANTAIGALRQYRLLESAAGADGADQLTLTQLARQLLAAGARTSPEDLREAALSPRIAAKVYSRWTDLPEDRILRQYLIAELGFSLRSVDGALGVLKENDTFAELSEWRRQVRDGYVELTAAHDRLLAHAGVTIKVQFSKAPNAEVLRFLAHHFSNEWMVARKLSPPPAPMAKRSQPASSRRAPARSVEPEAGQDANGGPGGTAWGEKGRQNPWQ